MVKCLLVGVGGGIGAILRYLIGLIPVGAQNNFPIKTLLINVIGAFVIGLISVLAEKYQVSPLLVLTLKTGVCGGFTTFSTFALETERELRIYDTLYRIKCDIKCCCGICCTNTYEVTMKR